MIDWGDKRLTIKKIWQTKIKNLRMNQESEPRVVILGFEKEQKEG